LWPLKVSSNGLSEEDYRGPFKHMRDIFTFSLIASTIRLATPLVLAALGGLFSERSGVINIALEGKMLAGAFTAAALTHAVDTRTGLGAASPWIGLLGGMIAGLFIAAIYALSCIKFKADQVVSGAAINILMLGMPGLLSGAFFLSSGSTPQIPKDRLLPQSPTVIAIAILALVAGIWYVVYKTPFGLRLRSVGENPEAADAAGVSVSRIRYSGVLLAGILAGIGGAYLSIGQSSLFTRNMTAGRGFIALAALIFGKWRPVQTLLACLLFGFTEAVSIQMQGVFKLPSGEDIPVQFIQMVPYVLTIVVLAGFIGSSRPPGALGIPYQKEK
jgi:simple sugar transport system permease protein